MKMYAKLSRNLLQPVLTSSTRFGVTATKQVDGSFVLSGEVVDGYVGQLQFLVFYLNEVKEILGTGETYSFSTGSNLFFLVFAIEKSDGTKRYVDGDRINTVTLADGETLTGCWLQIYSEVYKGGEIAYPMISKNHLPYEPYMENPIQPIKFLYKSRQLFDRSLPKFSGWAYIDNFTDNTITVIEKGNVPSTAAWRSINIPIYGLEEGDTITISGEWVNSSNNKGTVMVRWFEPSSLGVGKISAELQTSGGVATGVVTAKPTETAQLCVALYINTNGTLAQYDTVTYKNVMVCKGDKALPYEPYMPLTKMKAFYKSRNLFDKNNYKTKTDNSGRVIALFDISKLVIGEKYTFSSNLPFTWFKISEDSSGYNSVQKADSNGFTEFTFTMARHANISESSTQYLILSTSKDITDIPIGGVDDLEGYNVMLNKGSTALPYEPPQEYPN